MKKLAEVIVGNDTPNKLSGKDLVDFFNEFGFNDDFVYPNVGITTSDIGEGLSCTDYTRKRLRMLNDKQQIDVVISLYIDGCSDKTFAENSINTAMGKAPDIKDPVDSMNIADFTPHSQFDDIKLGIPTVFVSYSWDDEEHRKWVKQFSDDLRSKHNICTLLDQYNPAGADIVEFMNKGLRLANRVLMIGTPIYKQKSEDGIGTGGKYEGVIITTEIYNNTDTLKFIPLLRRGDSFKASFMNIVATRNGYDFREDTTYETKLKELADEIYGRNKKAPALGGTITIDPNVTSIATMYKGEKWLKELLEHFSVYLMDQYFQDMPSHVNVDLVTSHDCWFGILKSTAFQMKDKQLLQLITNFFNQWNAITTLGCKYYFTSQNPQYYRFEQLQHDAFLTNEAQKAFAQITQMVIDLQPLYKSMMDYIKDNYPSIDLDETSQTFQSIITR